MQLALYSGKASRLDPCPRVVEQCRSVQLQLQQRRPGILRRAHVVRMPVGVLAMRATGRVIGRTGLGTHRVGAAAAILQKRTGDIGAAMLVSAQGIDPGCIPEYPLLDRRRFRWRQVCAQVAAEGSRLVREHTDTLVAAKGAAGDAGDRGAGRARGSEAGIQRPEQVTRQRIAACWRAIRSQLPDCIRRRRGCRRR